MNYIIEHHIIDILSGRFFSFLYDRGGKMNKRIIDIIEKFNNYRGRVDIKQLSKELGVNQRTIRYDIDKINEELGKKDLDLIEKLTKGGLEGDVNSLNLLLDGLDLDENIFQEYKDVLILIMITFEENININSLCEKFDLGRTTIKTTLKDIKKILDLYKLELILKPQKGLKLIGKEENIRRLQLKLLNQYSSLHKENNFERKYIRKKIDVYFCGIDPTFIEKFINFIIKSLNRMISDEAYTTIFNYIMVTILRVKKERPLLISPNENFFYETEEYKVIKRSIALIESNYDLVMDTHELLKLTDYFLGSHLYNASSSFLSNWIEIEILTKRIIHNFSDLFSCDLSKDKFLLDGLINHIKPTVYRMKNFTELENTIEDEFKNLYPHIFADTKNALKLLEEFMGLSIPDSETAFIGMHFKAAIDRNKVRETKNILVVCGMGYGTSKLISQQIRSLYEVNILDIIPQNQLQNYVDNSSIDLILTTSMNEEYFNGIPIVKVKPILTVEDFNLIDTYSLPKYNNRIPLSLLINAVENNTDIIDREELVKQLKEVCGKQLVDDTHKNSLKISDLLNNKSIHLEKKVNNWEEAIELSGKILEDNGNITNNYTKKMIESIKKNGSYMVTEDSLALPHAKNDGDVFYTGMSLLILEEEVEFPQGFKVKVILSFCSLDSKEHLDALTEFIELVKKYNFLEFLKKERSKKKIVDKINKYNFLTKLGKY